MFSLHTTQQFRQAIALMLGCVVPAASWAPAISISTNEGRGYNKDLRNRVFEKHNM